MAHPHYKVDGATGKPVQVSDPGWAAPRLTKALLEAPVGTFPCFHTSFEKRKAEAVKAGKAPPAPISPSDLKTRLDELLQHIEDRLQMGLAEAWLSPQGYGSWPDFDKIVSKIPSENVANKETIEAALKEAGELLLMWAEPEEHWAREICECFVFIPYAGPNVIYGLEFKEIYKEYPTWYAIVAACQHFSTYALLSRGCAAGDLGSDGCGCNGGTTAFPCFEAHDTSPSLASDPKWIAAEARYKPDFAAWQKAAKDYKDAKDASKKTGGTPSAPPPGPMPSHGDAKYGYPRQTSAPAFADTTALTSDPIKLTPGSIVSFNPGGGASTYQDLGSTTHIGTVLRVMKPRIQFMDTGVLTSTMGGGEGGTGDHGFINGTIPAAESCVGWGRAKPPSDLMGSAVALSKSRPLGFVRFMLVDTSQDKPRICYVSKLLHQRYALSRFIWSLRGLPVENLAAYWLVYAPQGTSWTNALIKDAPPGKPPAQLLSGSGSLFFANVVRGTAGSVSVYRHKAAGTNGWFKDFAGGKVAPPPTPEMGLGYRLIVSKAPLGSQPKVASWLDQQGNFDKSFIHVEGDMGSVGTADVSVAFFKPA